MPYSQYSVFYGALALEGTNQNSSTVHWFLTSAFSDLKHHKGLHKYDVHRGKKSDFAEEAEFKQVDLRVLAESNCF